MLQISLMVVVVAITGVVRSDSSQCCLSEQFLISLGNDTFNCWDPIKNTTSLVPLGCNNSYTFWPDEDLDYYVNSDGQMVFFRPNFEHRIEPGTFCVGQVAAKRNVSRLYRMALVCYEENTDIIEDEVYGFCMLVSCVLLLITAIIHIALPELRDLQGKSIINFCLSLGIGLGLLACLKLIAHSNMDLCTANGFLTYFFIIASFFWMNAISVQILFSIRRPTVLNYGWKEFMYYAIYAWGCTAVLTIAMAIVNFIPGDHKKPGIGLNRCWFFNERQQWYYMYSVMSILIILNIVIFLYTSYILWRQSFSSSHLRALRYKFVMTIRMSVVMGVAWIFEMIGSLTKSHWFWEIMNIVNSLQGVLIFLVLVVCRRRVIKAMHKHGWLDCISGRVEKCLAVGEDEEDVVQHTIGYSLDQEPGMKNPQ